MLRTVSNGQSIHQYIPPDLRRMFYKNPARPHASNNGLDPYGFSTEGLVLYLPLWALNNGGTNSIQSVDAYRHTGVVTGALWQPDGRHFVTDDAINISGSSDFNFERTDAFAIEMWVKIATAASGDRLIAKQQSTNNRGYFVSCFTGGEINWTLINDDVPSQQTNIRSTGSITDNAWHHLVCQNLALAGGDATDVEIYIDKVLDVNTITNTLGANTILTSATMSLASSRGTAGFLSDGIIGEVRFYNRSFAPAEVAHNRNATIWRYQ